MAELQDIFNLLDKSFLSRLDLGQRKVFSAITYCRTSMLGYHPISCDHCDYEKFAYNSCRNRNCPKCQTLTKEQWIHKQEQYLLDIPYFHVVFTLPSELNHIAYQNQSTVYTLFFKAVSETLKELTLDEKYLGAKLGLTSILHTWGQNLTYHPHIHCIILGGGLTADGKWKNSRIVRNSFSQSRYSHESFVENSSIISRTQSLIFIPQVLIYKIQSTFSA